MTNGVFISYRRQGGAEMARLIHEHLRRSGYKVFMDVEDLERGHFDKNLYAQIESCADVVLVLSPGALDRCTQPDDWVRLEISHAIEKEKNIVPVWTSNFTLPPMIPEEIKVAIQHQGVNWSHDHFQSSMTKLQRYLQTKKARSITRALPYAIAAVVILAISASLFAWHAHNTKDHAITEMVFTSPAQPQPATSPNDIRGGGQTLTEPEDQESEKQTLAVLYFEMLSDGHESLRSFTQGLQSMLTSGFNEQGLFAIVERERINDVMEELNLSQGDAFDAATAARIGRLLGAHNLVFGTVFEAFGQYRIDARMVQVETGLVLRSAAGTATEDQMFEIVDSLVTALTTTK